VPLPDPDRSYVMLVGTSDYRSGALAALPSVANNLEALADVLCDPKLGGFSRSRCRTVSNPDDAHQLYLAMQRCARAADDTFLVYFAGHGRLGPRNELYLTLTVTDPDALRTSAFAYDLVREVFAQSPASNKAVILDCCLSGVVLPDLGAVEDQLAVEGTYTLTAARDFGVALAPKGQRYTAFTGELITLLRQGLPDGPELLTFGDIYPQLLRATTRLGLPRPGQGNTGTAYRLALRRNPAWRAPGAAHPPAKSSPVPGLTIPLALYTAMVGHARRDHPNVVCGVLTGPAGTGRPTRFIPITNAAASTVYWELDPFEQLDVLREADARDEEIVLLYFSHTATAAFPAGMTVQLADRSWFYAIISTRAQIDNEFRCFSIIDGEVTEIAVEFADAGPHQPVSASSGEVPAGPPVPPETVREAFVTRLAREAPSIGDRVLKYAVHPVDLLDALAQKLVRHTEAPDSYVVYLSVADYGWYTPGLAALARQLAVAQAALIAARGWAPRPVQVQLCPRADYEPGLFKVDVRSERARR
jgi:proteasome lid subunit RPN8/RPN11